MFQQTSELHRKLQNVKQKLQENFEQRTEFLKECELIQRCPSWCRNDIIAKLRQTMVLKTYAKEQTVMDSSLATFNLYLTYSGEVGCYLDEKVLQKKLKSGQSFGELAYTFNRASKTSYRCLETCQIYVVTKSDIPTILKEFERKYQAKLTAAIFKQSSFFSEWDLGSVSYLNYYGQLQNFVRNQTVYSSNQPSDGIYLIVSGEFSYSIKKKTEKKQLMINQEGEIDSDEERKKLEKEVYDLRTQNIQKTFVSKISTLSTGQIFGEEEVLKKTNRNYETTCESVTGEVMFFNAHVFWSLIYSNPLYKVMVDDKVKKQDIVKKRQIHFIKSSMDDYDHYLLGKQYAQGAAHINLTEEDLSSSIKKHQTPSLIPLSRNSSQQAHPEQKKSKKQQEKDEIKIAIDKIPILDLQRINDQAKQFNQYSFNPKEEKFNSPNEQETFEAAQLNGNLTGRNMLKLQMRTNSTINNQCQLEFIKMQGVIHLPSGNATSRGFTGNGMNNFASQTSLQNNQNQMIQNATPQKQGYIYSAEELDKGIVCPSIEHSPRVNDQNGKNKQSSGVNQLLLPISAINSGSFNTPINSNINTTKNIQQNSNQNSNQNNNNNNNKNKNELFELIMQHNSKKYGKQFNRMKKFIQEGDKMQEMNRKKYSLQNLFGADRSTPRSFIPQITSIMQDKSSILQSPCSFNQPISQFFPNTNSHNKDQGSYLQQGQNTSTQDDMIDTSRQQTMNFLTSNVKSNNLTSIQVLSGQVSPANSTGYIFGDKVMKSFQPSSFAQAVLQHSSKATQNVLAAINQQQQSKSNENSSNGFHQQSFNLNGVNCFNKDTNMPGSAKVIEAEKKEVVKCNFNLPNLQLLLNSQSNLEHIEEKSSKREMESSRLPEREYRSQITINEDDLSTTREKLSQQHKKDRLILTDRQYKSKTSSTAFRIGKSNSSNKQNQFQNKIISDQMDPYSSPLIPKHSTDNFISPPSNSNNNYIPLSARNTNYQYSSKQLFSKDINSQRDSNYSQFPQALKKASICSDTLFIEVDPNVKVTPMQFYNQKKTSVTTNFINTLSTSDNKLQTQSQLTLNHVKHTSLASVPQFDGNSQSIVNLQSMSNQNQGEGKAQFNPKIDFLSQRIPSETNKRIRVKSDQPYLQKIFTEDQNLQSLKHSGNNNPLISPRLVLKQTRPLYHDSNSYDLRGQHSKQQQQQQHKSTSNKEETLLQKHIIKKFQIQDQQSISTLIEKIADSQKNKRLQLPQQYIMSYTNNQSSNFQNSQSQHTKSISDLPFLKQFYKPSAAPATGVMPNTSKNQVVQHFDKRENYDQIKFPLYENKNDSILKTSFEKEKSGRDLSPNSKIQYVCEDLGYNFIKTKMQ